MSIFRPKFEVQHQNVGEPINSRKSIKNIPISIIVEKKINDNNLDSGVLSSNNPMNAKMNEKKIANKNPIYDFNKINIERGK